MRILFLTQLLPYPPICGGTIKSYNTLKHLCQMHEVTLVSFIRRESEAQHMDEIMHVCSNVYLCEIKRSKWLNARDAAKSLVGGKPFIVSRDMVPEMKRLVDRLLVEQQFDLVYVDHLQMSQYVTEHSDCPKVLDEHNVEWKIIQRIAENERSWAKRAFAAIEWRKLKTYELKSCRSFDRVLTVSEEDRRTLEEESYRLANVRHIPIGVDLNRFEQIKLDPASKTILSLATMSWPPNIDSAIYFAKEIFPIVKTYEPEVTLVLAGNNPSESVRNLAEKDPSIEVPGFVEDVARLVSQAAVMIVPLRSGSGMRVKILNSMAMGLPVVSTSVGCEGIPVVNGRDVLIADDPVDFAKNVCLLLNDTNLRFEIASNGRKLVEENFTWEKILPELDRALSETVAGVGRRVFAG